MSLNELINPSSPLDIKVNNIVAQGDLNVSGSVIFDTFSADTLEIKDDGNIGGDLTIGGNLNAGGNHFSVDSKTGDLLMTDGKIAVGTDGIFTTGSITVDSSDTPGTGGIVYSTSGSNVRVKASSASGDKSHTIPDVSDGSFLMTTGTQTATGDKTFSGGFSITRSNPIAFITNTSATGRSMIEMLGTSPGESCDIIVDDTGSLSIVPSGEDANIILQTINGTTTVTNPVVVSDLIPINAITYTDAKKNVLGQSLNNGELLIGSTGNTPINSTLSGGAGISVLNGPGSITLSVSTSSTSYLPDLSFGGDPSGITYNSRSGEYQRLGNIVFFNISFVALSLGLASGGAAVSLPFQVSSTSVVNISSWQSITITSGVLSGLTVAGQSIINLYNVSDSGTTTQLTDTDFSTPLAGMRITGFYFTA